jgi:hypothetical protein
MPAAAVLPDNALWRPWADLPLDLLRDISRRLHATTDYVRFHATCKPWRDTLPRSCHGCSRHQTPPSTGRLAASSPPPSRRSVAPAPPLRYGFEIGGG